jgi:hypothetical protein
VQIITWDKDDVKGTIELLDKLPSITKLINDLVSDKAREYMEEIKTEDAIEICKMKLMGEYHAIFVRQMEEMLEDAEIYLLTWDEVIEGGQMDKIDYFKLREIAREEAFKGESTD